MNNRNEFVDKTVTSTPEPFASSTTQKRITRQIPTKLDDTFEVNSDESLGIISFKSEDLIGNVSNADRLDAGANLQNQRLLASTSLQRATRLSGLPSRYFKHSNITKQNSESCLNLSGSSTISESDLFKSGNKPSYENSSTPRTSVLSNSDADIRPKYSLSKSIADLSEKIKNTDYSMDNFAQEFNKVMQSVIIEEDSALFTPGEQIEAKLIADEISWRKHNDIPGQASLAFTEQSLPLKESMGEFFRKRSDSISDLDMETVSPEKKSLPLPLIDVTNSEESRLYYAENRDSQNLENRQGENKSLSVTKIAKLLAEVDQTPRKVIDYLFNQGNVFERSSYIKGPKNSLKVLEEDKTERNELMSQQVECSPPLHHSSGFNKENINSLNIPDSANTSVTRKSPTEISNYANRSVTSLRSTSSLSHLVGGRLPIEATKNELVWGCVKLGKSVTQSVLVRNKSQNRLRIQCSISGPSYKILREPPDSGFVSIVKYVMQPGESKTITISFAPIQVGAAVDEVLFTPVDSNLQQSKMQRIRLNGYGGHGNIDISNVTKDTSGKFWLCLGQLDNRVEITENIIVQNNGTLPAFGYMTFESKEMYTFASINISPSKFVLLPQEQRAVTVTYVPSRNDLKLFQSATSSSVIDIGLLKLISGTEINRGRIRKLTRQAVDKGLSSPQVCLKIVDVIPGEVMPSDLQKFRESISSVTNLLQELTTKEIVVTLEQDTEKTLVAQFPDDTLQFQSLYEDNTLSEHNLNERLFRLEPSCVILTPPSKVDDKFFIFSDSSDEVCFEVKTEPKNLMVHPEKGLIKPGKTVIINVRYSSSCKNVCFYKIFVLLKGCALEGDIKILEIAS